MAGKFRDWDQRQRLQSLQEAQKTSVEAKRKLVHQKPTAKARAVTDTETVMVPTGYGDALSTPISGPVRYERTSDDNDTLVLAEGLPIIATVHQSMGDRADRILQTWPSKPENAFIIAAMSILEGRLHGKLRHGSIGLWPWRSSLTAAARSILVEPTELLETARTAVNDLREGKGWIKPEVAMEEYQLLLMRLQDLRPKGGFVVRRPTLLEITPVFGPSDEHLRTRGRQQIYDITPDQFLNRIRNHTLIGNAKMADNTAPWLRRVGDPMVSPYAVFGLPTDTRTLSACLKFQRFARLGLDVIIADLTRPARELMGRWEKNLKILLEALVNLGQARPGVVVVCDDAFVARKANEVFKAKAKDTKPPRRFPERRGVLLLLPSLLSSAASKEKAPLSLPPIKWEIDLKDGSLVDLRDKLLSLAQKLDEAGLDDHSRAVKLGLQFVRRIVALPVGFTKARAIIEILYPGDDERDTVMRGRYFRDHALYPLNQAIADSGVFTSDLKDAYYAILKKVDQWAETTPIALKLGSILGAVQQPKDHLLVFPTKSDCDIYQSADAWLTCRVPVIEARALRFVLDSGQRKQLILVQPNIDTVRTILLHPNTPQSVIVIGDASGARLLAGELRPLIDLEGFAAVRDRAKPLLEAIGKSERDLGGEDPDLEIVVPKDYRTLDFTQEDESGTNYSGAIVRIQTSGGYTINYRGNAWVLRSTPDEVRAFQKVQASKLAKDDAILVMSRPLMMLLREHFARMPKTLENLRQYHKAVASRVPDIPGKSISDKAREILRRIQLVEPKFEDDELSNIKRWLSVQENTVDDPAAMPFAPKTLRRYKLFVDALGIHKSLAEVYWNVGIRPTRAYRIREGLHFHERAVDFVIDPESTLTKDRDGELAALWQIIIQNVDVIEKTEIINVSAPSCAPCPVA
ncbi:MAG: hypothetical protein FD176_198 [Rhodospirillaceae bacterium]|nr:MAG: hypothetical protein FD176_198 [Rhodospirillaceae bacterium]TNC98716.1 MAG: hypothetical protein FD119_187 [Stygiobacter sp.]